MKLKDKGPRGLPGMADIHIQLCGALDDAGTVAEGAHPPKSEKLKIVDEVGRYSRCALTSA